MSRQPNEWQSVVAFKKNSYREILKYSLGLDSPTGTSGRSSLCVSCAGSTRAGLIKGEASARYIQEQVLLWRPLENG